MNREGVTGLLYYEIFKEKAERLICAEDKEYALVSLNIDNFKYVNQMYGYKKGDELLMMVSNYFCTDRLGIELACREYSDHFMVLIDRGKDTTEKVIETIRKDMQEFSERVNGDFPLFRIRVYGGIYFFQKNEWQIESAIDGAETARRSIKQDYTQMLAVYDDTLRQLSKEREIIPDFEQAVRENRIIVYLQPKFDIEKKEIVGAESLVRMRSVDGRILSPQIFIPILERAGLIYKLDMIVIKKTLEIMHGWMEKGIEPVVVSMNLSRTDFVVKEFDKEVGSALRETMVPPKYLEFEVTETVFVEEVDYIANALNRLRSLGYKVSIDDFGSGYSTLNAVGSLPADEIKFDRSFVQNSIKTKKGMLIMRKLIEMFADLDMEVICEGVETKEEEELVRECGCKYIQGYVYDKPLAVEEFEKKYMSTRK